MAWKVRFEAETGVISSVYTGTVTEHDANQATAEALALAQGDGPHLFLADLLDADPHVSIAHIYGLPAVWRAAGANRANKLALVVPREGRVWEDASFYETTCRNHGWQVGLFAKPDEAIAWLMGSPATTERGY